MTQQVRADYDFDAQAGSGELNLKTGDILRVIRKGIDGGWMEGQNAKGKIGLFPESYVSAVTTSSVPPAVAPPPLPSLNTQFSSRAVIKENVPSSAPIMPAKYVVPPSKFDDVWDDPRVPIPPTFSKPTTKDSTASKDTTASSAPSASISIDQRNATASTPNFGSSGSGTNTAAVSYPQLNPTSSDYLNDDDFDDEWGSDDDEEIAEFSANNPNAIGSQKGIVGRSRSTGPETISTTGKQMGTAKMKTINRFSNFVKTGMESYILAASRLTSEPTERHLIGFNKNNQIEWHTPNEVYTCIVNKPKKESKLKGLKSFIAYSVTYSLSGIQVSRRYKHFDWLHDQLSNKYLLIPIPPLPEKQVAGRYEDDLIEHRKLILQLWVNKICRHPVLSQSAVWRHFMTCTDERKWKNGKRAAEKDEYVGGNFFHCVTVPTQPLDSVKIERQIESYAKCVRNIDESVKELHDRILDTQKRLIGPYKSNWQKIAAAFESLGKSIEQDQPTNPVKDAIKTSAHVLHKVGSQHEEHAKKDLEQLISFLYTYKGLFTNIPDIVNVHKSALSKARDNDRLHHEGRVSAQDAEAVRQRVDVTTYAVMAEITHLNKERDSDFRQMFGAFFEQQAAFYTQIGQQMAQLSELFNKEAS